jgi:hypothetical protein
VVGGNTNDSQTASVYCYLYYGIERSTFPLPPRALPSAPSLSPHYKNPGAAHGLLHAR